jgi:hypothetical protein
MTTNGETIRRKKNAKAMSANMNSGPRHPKPPGKFLFLPKFLA